MQDWHLRCPPTFSLVPQWSPHCFHSSITNSCWGVKPNQTMESTSLNDAIITPVTFWLFLVCFVKLIRTDFHCNAFRYCLALLSLFYCSASFTPASRVKRFCGIVSRWDGLAKECAAMQTRNTSKVWGAFPENYIGHISHSENLVNRTKIS